jgi:hypothetical protein
MTQEIRQSLSPTVQDLLTTEETYTVGAFGLTPGFIATTSGSTMVVSLT